MELTRFPSLIVFLGFLQNQTITSTTTTRTRTTRNRDTTTDTTTFTTELLVAFNNK